MGYKMQLEAETLFMKDDFFSPSLLESTTIVKNDAISMELNEVSLPHFHLIHGKRLAAKDSSFSIDFYNSFYIMHFVLNNTLITGKRSLTAHALNAYSTCY